MASPLRTAGRGAFVVAVVLAGCGAMDGATSDPTPERLEVGFVHVGTIDDLGYNEAAHDGAEAVRRAFPDAEVTEVEHVPESPAAEPVMQRLIARGADIVVATSFGHLEPALNVAAANPSVTFLHQGGLETAPNLGTYFGTIWQAQYAVGQAAGLVTKTDRLGFVAAYPIAQSLLTINAFELGARSVNPRVRTRVTFTSDWCRPGRQRAAARRLLRWGADVLAQHQDCTRSVLEVARDHGAWGVGYHHDGREATGDRWLVGAAWNWGPVLRDAVDTIRRGEFAGSAYAGRYRGGAREGVVELTNFGPAVPRAVRDRVGRTFAAIRAGTVRPFDGPIRDQRGRIRIAGRQPPVTELEEMDYLVEGVVGRAGEG